MIIEVTKNQRLHISKHIAQFIATKVKIPITGFDQKSQPRGGTLSIEKQLSETHRQVLYAADYYTRQGYPDEKILHMLSYFVKSA